MKIEKNILNIMINICDLKPNSILWRKQQQPESDFLKTLPQSFKKVDTFVCSGKYKIPKGFSIPTGAPMMPFLII